MYLYYDRTGKLKEVINDEALRQGNYGVNKLYIYIDRNDVASIDITYLLPSQLIVGPQNYDDREEAEIPFDEKRDIYWFKYHKTYNFFVIDLEADINGNGPLDEAGLVHCDMQMNLDSSDIYTLGELNFNVEVNSVLNQKQVATQEYMSLSNYLFLRSISVPYTGATKDLDLGNYTIRAREFQLPEGYVYSDSGNVYIGTGIGKVILAPETIAEYAGAEIANKNDVPKKQVLATFNTDDFILDEETGIQSCVVNINVGYIENSDLLIITWGGCFAICPIPQSGAGRVCAALWNADGESQITRIRYEIVELGGRKNLVITLPSSFQLPSNFTGYVINYKIA